MPVGGNMSAICRESSRPQHVAKTSVTQPPRPTSTTIPLTITITRLPRSLNSSSTIISRAKFFTRTRGRVITPTTRGRHLVEQYFEKGWNGRLAESSEGGYRRRYFHSRDGRVFQTAAKLAGGTKQRPPDRLGVVYFGRCDAPSVSPIECERSRNHVALPPIRRSLAVCAARG